MIGYCPFLIGEGRVLTIIGVSVDAIVHGNLNNLGEMDHRWN